jgi:choline kinase
MDPEEADGENLGVVKFGAEGARELVTIMDRLIAAGGVRDWAPRAFREFAQLHPLHAVGTRGFPWIEIDFPEDYQRAVRDVVPLIDGYESGNDLHMQDLPVLPAAPRLAEAGTIRAELR